MALRVNKDKSSDKRVGGGGNQVKFAEVEKGGGTIVGNTLAAWNVRMHQHDESAGFQMPPGPLWLAVILWADASALRTAQRLAFPPHGLCLDALPRLVDRHALHLLFLFDAQQQTIVFPERLLTDTHPGTYCAVSCQAPPNPFDCLKSQPYRHELHYGY